jgi:hypothetical protein
MKKVFFSQQLLDSLADEGRISLDHNVLTLLSKDRPTFTLEPAFRFTGTADGKPDLHGLVGTIRSAKDIRDMKAEIYLDSILFEETAYQTVPGFIGEEQALMEKLSDTDLLTRFLLENLS